MGSNQRLDGAVSKIIGANLRKYRIESKRTCKQISQIIGVSPQQILKYETGENHIKATDLYQISKELNISISLFFL